MKAPNEPVGSRSKITARNEVNLSRGDKPKSSPKSPAGNAFAIIIKYAWLWVEFVVSVCAGAMCNVASIPAVLIPNERARRPKQTVIALLQPRTKRTSLKMIKANSVLRLLNNYRICILISNLKELFCESEAKEQTRKGQNQLRSISK